MHNNRTDKRSPMVRRRLESLLTSEQFTFQQILSMFIPLVLDQLFIFVIGIVSTAMVSSSGEAAISAVSLVGSVGFIVSALFSALGTGGTICVARMRGGGDSEKVRVAIGQTMLLTTLTATVCTGVFIGFAEPIVRAVYPNVEPLVFGYAVHYLQLMSLSYIPYALFNAVFGVFRGLGDSKSSLALTITINTVHLAASFVFINVLRLSVTGSGLSYILARTVGAVVAVLWMFKIRNPAGMRARYIFRAARDVQRRIAGLAAPLAVEQILFQVGILLTQTYIATLPTAAIAANGIANSAFGLYNAVAFTLTTMVTTVCGQCVGAGKPELARRYCQSFITVGRFVLLASVLVISPLMPLVLSLYSPTSGALPQIYLALAIAVLPSPLLWCDANLTGSALRAAGDAAYVTTVSLIAMWVARVGVGYFLTITLGLGIAGVWIGLLLDWCVRIAMLRPRIKGERWVRKAV